MSFVINSTYRFQTTYAAACDARAGWLVAFFQYIVHVCSLAHGVHGEQQIQNFGGGETGEEEKDMVTKIWV